ncbi:cache domain-containing sensor histidine kinase [Paenibacillus sinopodophylli]|uniref:cache domain-containing sensor histidine kinase n=1 Tax=Paenibacillus sinopodophylli TaxID=1837342 RepID=UPI00110CC606|nr:sensor histidine kinase [Paenibacillus sinopodophylli]
MRRQLNAISIKSKVMLAFVLLILLPFSVLGLYTYDQSQQFVRAQLVANSATALKQMKHTIENKIDLIESVSDSITFNYRLQEFLESPFSEDNNSLDTYFSYAAPLINYAMLFQKVNTEKISVFMNNETIPEGFGAFYHSFKAKREPWYDSFVRSGLKSAWIVRDNTVSGQTFAFVQKMISLEGNDLGFTLVEVRPSDLLATAQEPSESGQDIVIADEQGHILYPEESENPLSSLLLQTLSTGDYSMRDGRLYIGEKLKGVGLSMLMTVSQPRRANSLQAASNLVFIATMVVLLFSFYSVLKMVLRKMRTSIRQMDQAIEADFKPIPIDRRDEFGVITEKFNLLLNKVTMLMKDMIRKETMQKDAQLAALQAQINPHFIYNTLDMFSARMELAGQFEESDAMADFGKMMRYNMDGKSKFATLESEIRYLEQYMNLQKIKYGSDIELSVQVPERLLPLRVIRFLLQPVVENSIRHGFPANGLLRIGLVASLQSDDTVLLSIRDNGPGVEPARLAYLNQQFKKSDYTPANDQTRESIGLGNINERLKLFYGEEYSIRLISVEGEYAETVITIPYDAGEEDSHVQRAHYR